MTNDRLEWYLENWAKFMRKPAGRLGYPARSLCMITGGYSAGVDAFEHMCEEVDTQQAMCIDGIIDSLILLQRTAINHIWLKVAHHHPTQELDYEDAISNILRIANKRGLI